MLLAVILRGEHMSREIPSEQKERAKNLRELIETLSIEACRVVSMVSLPTCEDVIVHHEKDMRKLLLIEGHQVDGIHPSKHIGYLARIMQRFDGYAPLAVAVA
jgi:hypothetical protein